VRYTGIVLFTFICFFILSCWDKSPTKDTTSSKSIPKTIPDKGDESLVEKKPTIILDTSTKQITNSSLAPEKKKDAVPPSVSNSAAGFTELSKVNGGIITDIKYATTDNFTKKQIYPCGKCYLRPLAAAKIKIAQEKLKSKYGYGLKMFDCYRPRPAQQRLWDVVPNPDYVTPPAKGSMHNKGLAVDLTVVDKNGKELNMGTPYDFFGVAAHADNMNHTKEVLDNRAILTNVMKEVGFTGIRTEWWHFSLASSDGLADWEWPCD
jgi:zinc D-Ala-D-Ala dipeptidase